MRSRTILGGTAPSALRGALSGLAGTLAMSAVMLPAGWTGILGRQPPRVVADAVADSTETTGGADDAQRSVLATVIHLGIGAVGGVPLALIRGAIPSLAGRRVAPVVGAAYGLGLWATNYIAIAPALRLLPPPRDDRPGRPPVMIAAHVVFGVTAALAADALLRVTLPVRASAGNAGARIGR